MPHAPGVVCASSHRSAQILYAERLVTPCAHTMLGAGLAARRHASVAVSSEAATRAEERNQERGERLSVSDEAEEGQVG